MTAVGLTYQRGRVAAPTTESASLARVAGQFTAPFLSAPVRGSGPGRVRLTVDGMLTATSGAVVIFCDPDNANGGGGQQANGLLFCWRASAAERIELEYTKGSTVLTARRLTASAGATATASLTFAAGDPLAVLIAWDATTLYVAANGGIIATAGNTSIPVGLPTTLDIGSQDGATAGTYFNAAYAAVLLFSAPLTATQWQTLAALRTARAPVLGEGGTDLLATGLWYGAHALVHELPASGAVIDLNDGAGGDILLLNPGLLGAGFPSINNRAVQTPLRDGSTYIDTLFNARRMTAPLLVRAVTQVSELAVRRRQIVDALNPKYGQGIVQYAPLEAGQVYEITAIVDGGVEFREPLGQVALLPLCNWVCEDPYWRAGVQSTSSGVSALGGWAIPWSIPWSITANAVTLAAQNDGDVAVYPLITITAGGSGASGISLSNDTTGKTFTLSLLTLAAGETLSVDMDGRTAVVGSTNVLGMGRLGSIWSLAVGLNSVTVSMSSGSGTITISWPTRLAGI